MSLITAINLHCCYQQRLKKSSTRLVATFLNYLSRSVGVEEERNVDLNEQTYEEVIKEFRMSNEEIEFLCSLPVIKSTMEPLGYW